MKTLVIHPADYSTDFLSDIYSDRGYTILRCDCSKNLLKNKIKNHDRIIMLGHGTGQGLIGYGRFIINCELVQILRTKLCIGVWCFANEFFEKYKLTGFYTGMIISEYEEALTFSVPIRNMSDIDDSNKLLATAIAQCIDSDDTNDIFESVKKMYLSDSVPIIQYNSQNIFCNQK